MGGAEEFDGPDVTMKPQENAVAQQVSTNSKLDMEGIGKSIKTDCKHKIINHVRYMYTRLNISGHGRCRSTLIISPSTRI